MQQESQYRKEKEGFNSGSWLEGDRKKELTYRIEQEIKKEIQPPLRDISYGLANSLSDTVYRISSEASYPSRKASLDYFDKTFMQRELARVKGNITQYVRDAFSVNEPAQINNLRKTVYRDISKFGLFETVNNARPWKQNKLEDRISMYSPLGADKVESSLSSALSGYKGIIQPKLYDDISYRIREKAPLIAKTVSEYMPTPANRLKEIAGLTEGVRNYGEARAIFERQVIYDALNATNRDKKKAAGYLGDSLRTLNRRIAELGIGKEAKRETAPKIEISIEAVVKSDKTDQHERPRVVSEIERFQQLVAEYNARREMERARKEGTPRNGKKQVRMAA
jgi:hypothetical protein